MYTLYWWYDEHALDSAITSSVVFPSNLKCWPPPLRNLPLTILHHSVSRINRSHHNATKFCHKSGSFMKRLRNFLSVIRLIIRTLIPEYTWPNPEMSLYLISKWCSSWNTRKQLLTAAGYNNNNHDSGSMCFNLLKNSQNVAPDSIL